MSNWSILMSLAREGRAQRCAREIGSTVDAFPGCIFNDTLQAIQVLNRFHTAACMELEPLSAAVIGQRHLCSPDNNPPSPQFLPRGACETVVVHLVKIRRRVNRRLLLLLAGQSRLLDAHPRPFAFVLTPSPRSIEATTPSNTTLSQGSTSLVRQCLVSAARPMKARRSLMKTVPIPWRT